MVESHPTRDKNRVFVGRQQEMAELTAALDDALSGRGRVVMLAGEAGIGKTCTTQVLAHEAEVRGIHVLWGWCYEEQGAPPYWPWVQAIRSYVREKDPGQLLAEMGPGAADIAEIVPDVAVILPNLETPPALEPEQARFRLFDSITSFLKQAAQVQPLMLVLDDLHWADKSSLLLLEFLSKETAVSRIMIVGLYRDVEVSGRHPLSQTLGNLIREQHFRRVHLGGLTQEEVGDFVEGTSGVILSRDTLELVHSRTQGNPLFVGEVARQLGSEGITQEDEWANTIPGGIREAVSRHLNRLSEQCNQMLTTASIIGREFDFKLLSALTGESSEDQLLALIDEALEAHLIEDMPGRPERYLFSHVLIQGTLSQGLSTSRRVRLHARIGEVLEITYGSETGDHAGELAYHFAEAEPVMGTEKLVRYSLLAGERALGTYAYEEALDYFQRAQSAKDGQSDPVNPLANAGEELDSESAAILYGLGRAQAAILPRHEAHVAFNSLSRAFDYYAQVGDVLRVVDIAEYPLLSFSGQLPMTELVARALELVPRNSPEEGRLLCHYGRVLGMLEADYEGAQETFDRALTVAKVEGDTVLEMRVLAEAAYVDRFHLKWQQGLEKISRVAELAFLSKDPRSEVTAHFWGASIHRTLGDNERARQHAVAGLSPAERLRDRYWLSSTFLSYEEMSRLEGSWPAARDFCERGLAVSPMDWRFLSLLAGIEFEVGNFEQGEAYLEQLLEAMRRAAPGPTTAYALPAMVIPMVARISGGGGHFDAADIAAETILSSDLATPLAIIWARSGLAMLAVERNDVTAAEEHYAALEPCRGTMVSPALVNDRLLGLLSMTTGRMDQAIAHFEEALTFCRRAGYRPELAWSASDCADALLQRNAYDDQAQAVALLHEALEVSGELGMQPLVERVTQQLARAEAQRGVQIYPDGLTEREVEVLRLVSVGKTNHEVAEELFISFRTVATHVTNILNKINSANRTEAALYASRHGLIPPEP